MKQEMYRGQFMEDERAEMWARVDEADRKRAAARYQRAMFEGIRETIRQIESETNED